MRSSRDFRTNGVYHFGTVHLKSRGKVKITIGTLLFAKGNMYINARHIAILQTTQGKAVKRFYWIEKMHIFRDVN